MEDYRLDQSGQEVQEILNGAAMQSELTAETERATEAEQTLQDNIDAEATRAQGAEGTLQDNIDAEEARAKAAEKQNADDIDAIDEKIPSGASSSNKLATEEYVNDSVATATATFRGSYNLVSDLHLNVNATEQQIAAALAGAISTADNNDYCFILVPTSSETPTEIKEIDRYKFNGTAWGFEYKLNNSGFTAAQWAAINSGITSGDVAKLAALPTNVQLTTLLAGLQSDIDGEEARAKAAELAIQGNIDAEETRAKAAEKQNADDIDAIEAVIPENASSENKVATKSEIDSLSAAIEAILLLIPSAATSLNKLADKAFVNSSIATATATFRGTYNLVDDLGLTTSATHAQIATALAGAILTADNNDYAFVQIPTSDAMPTEIAKTERYKFNGTAWEYEYDLNNSGFTADQWAAINSGITQALVTKLSDLPTNAELTTELGTLTSGITAINQKIPNAASQANKLVDTAAMESYIVEVLNVLTISYNVTSTDGHVTLSIEQVDGKITSVTLTTLDIASAAALNLKASQADLTALASRVTTAEGNITSLGGRMTTAEGNITTINGNITSLGGRLTTAESDITTLGGRVSTNETDIANLQQLYNDLQQSKPEPVTALPETGQQQGVIYRLAGTTSYSDYMWNGSTWVLMATYNNAIDPRPKKASQNLVTSGGVFDNMGALDVSELNATENPHTLAQYVDLSAALAAIPTDYQKGGMSIKYVQSSDNKYVQWRLMTNSFSTTITNWQGVDEEPTAGSQNLVKSGGVYPTTSIVKGVTNEKEIAFYTDTSDRLRVAAYHPFTLKKDHKYRFLIEFGNIVFNENTNVAYTLRLTTVNPISSADDPGIVAVLCNIAKEDYHTGTVEIEYFATKDSTYIYNFIGGADTNGDIKLSVVEYCISTDNTLQSPTLPAPADVVGQRFKNITVPITTIFNCSSSTTSINKYYQVHKLRKGVKYHFKFEFENLSFASNSEIALSVRTTNVSPISGIEDIVSIILNEILKKDFDGNTIELDYVAPENSKYIFTYIGLASSAGNIKISVTEDVVVTDESFESPYLPANAQSVGKKFNDISENGEDEYSYLSSTIGNSKYYELYRLRKDATYHFKFEFENLSFDSNDQIALSVRATTVNPISGGDDPGIIAFLVNEILKEDFDGSTIEFDYLAQESSTYIYTYIGNSITTGNVKMSVSYIQPVVDETLSTSLPAKAKTVGAALGKLQGSIGSKSYYGDRLDLSVKKYDLENIATIIGSTNQGADVSKNKLFEAFGDGSCKVYDFNSLSSTPLYTFNFACASADNHFNCINFGPKIPQGYSFPALYISTGKVGSPLEYKCHVEGITESGGVYTSTLLQTITFDTSDWEANGYMQIFGSPHILIDKERGFLWVFSAKYRTIKEAAPMSNNRYIATKFEIPSLSNNQVVLSGSDILEQKIFEFTTYFTQGGTMRNGKIYYSFGLGSNEYPANVRVFNTDDSSVCTEFNSINNSEPEDMFIVNNDLYFIDSDGKVFKFVV